MFEKIISLAVGNKLIVMMGVAALVVTGIYSLSEISIDAVPDITNNQVQIVTTTPSLAAEDVENFITYPIELAMANLPDVLEIRSISRYGLSLVTVVFGESVETMRARQFVAEQLTIAAGDIPPGFGSPEMMPITTGLGEIYQYVLEVDPEYADTYDAMELRTIQDWLVKRQLAGIEGVIETSSFGGYVKQYEVAFDPERLNAMQITIDQLVHALEANNANTGGGYISRGTQAVYIRTEGMLRSLEDIGRVPVSLAGSTPILVRDIADVRYGEALRYGALTKDGKGEAVGGITLMLKDANAKSTVDRVRARVAETQKTLPPGIRIAPYLDRSDLVERSMATVVKNLAEGGLFVAVILIFFLGNFRAGLLVASVIPLSMLFALSLMHFFGVSANLMSLGAIDFGIVVDGAVIIVEGILHYMAARAIGKHLTQPEMDRLVVKSSGQIYGSAAFGILIILVVFLPILQLQGIEGKMFRPMALTLMFALSGALILSLTYVPVMATYLLRRVNFEKKTFGERIMETLRVQYAGWLSRNLRFGKIAIPAAALILLISIWRISTMGSVFLPDLEEGDLAMQLAVPPGSSLETTVAASTAVEKLLLDSFPEVNHIVSKIGTAEVPTDPMSIEDADVMILLKPKDEWTSAKTREELVEQMKSVLHVFPELSFEFTQPIQLRFNELLTGSKADVAVKIFGDDPDELLRLGQAAARIITPIPGAEDVKLERTAGLQQLVVQYDREKMAWYGVHIDELNMAIQSAYAGAFAGIIADGERRFDLVVRLKSDARQHPDLSGLYVTTANGGRVPLSELAALSPMSGAAMISRENTRRRINLGVNVRDRSLTEVVADIQTAIESDLVLPPGYTVSYEGEFQNFQEARTRLAIAVPIALALILFLLYLVYRKWKYAFLVFAAVPLSAIGGIWLLYLRDMPFSISAGIGFIALFGVSVLNGIVLVSHINHLIQTTTMTLNEAIAKGASDRLRPVLLTALVATFGFVPMALSTSAGAEVQKPLATVVIGGLITATLLTLVLLPMLYQWMETGKSRLRGAGLTLLVVGLLTVSGNGTIAQDTINHEIFMERALSGNPLLEIQQIERDIVAARKGAAWELGATGASYSYGQLNRADIPDDYQWNFNQDFGSIPAHINRAKRNEAALQVSEAELAEYRVHFETGLRIDYLRWVYAHVRMTHFAEALNQLDSLNAMVVDQAEAGSISATERYLFDSQILRFRQMYNEAQVAVRGFQESLEARCLFALTDFTPVELDGFSVRVERPEIVETSVFTAAQTARVSESEFQVRTSRAAFFPALSAGYQVGRLEGVAGADAYTLGLAIPIWYGPDKALVRQASLRVLRENAQLETTLFQSDAALRRAQDDLNLRTAIFERDAEGLKNRSSALQNAALAGFGIGETDAYQLVQGLLTATDLYLTYLDVAEAYGISKYNLSRFKTR